MEHCADQPDAPRFGVEDLPIYVLSYYNNVIDIRNDTFGVRVRRVRIRANAFHCQSRGSEGGIIHGLRPAEKPPCLRLFVKRNITQVLAQSNLFQVFDNANAPGA